MPEGVEEQTTLTEEPRGNPTFTPAQKKLIWAVSGTFIFYIVSIFFCFATSGGTDLELKVLVSYFIDVLGGSIIPITVYIFNYRCNNFHDIIVVRATRDNRPWWIRSGLLYSLIFLSFNLVLLCICLIFFGYFLSTIDEHYSKDYFVLTVRHICEATVVFIVLHAILIWLGVVVLKEERKVYRDARESGLLETTDVPLVILTEEEKAKLKLTPSQKRLTWAFGASSLFYTVSFIFCANTIPSDSTDYVSGLFIMIFFLSTPMICYIISILLKYLLRNRPRIHIVGEQLGSFIKYRMVGVLIWGLVLLGVNCLIIGPFAFVEGMDLFSGSSRPKSTFVTIIVFIVIHIVLIWLGVLVVKKDWRDYKIEKATELAATSTQHPARFGLLDNAELPVLAANQSTEVNEIIE